MELRLSLGDQVYRVDLSAPLDISLPLQPGLETVNCFYAPPAEFLPHREGNFVGAIDAGAPVNFFNIRVNPHGNGTHTECLGHIAPGGHTLAHTLRRFHLIARLISVYPQRQPNGDRTIEPEQVSDALQGVDALVIRTLPNDEGKKQRHYSGTNPPYLSPAAAGLLAQAGIDHLLIDLPSVDKEEDGGKLLAHRAFWRYPERPRWESTISELIFVDNLIKDGLFLLNLQTVRIALDVSPSRPVLYPMVPC